MGREIRKVPPHWEHPRYTADDAPYRVRAGEYKPLWKGDFEQEKREWLDNLALWEANKHPAQLDGTPNLPRDWWDWDSDPPKRSDYVPYTEADATWVQMYETVSEGTPLSPPFATTDELVDWMCSNKDFWGNGPRTREQAERFVKGGWAPSFIVSSTAEGVQIGDGIDMLARIAAGDA